MIQLKDSLSFLKEQADNSADIIFCDPPYALGSEIVIRSDGKIDYKKASDFMNKWDMPTGAFWEDFYKEAMRVLKHGGHCVMFGMDRQLLLFKYYAHLAGFTEKQSLYWYFISNFPKATDLSKMIDKNAGAEREVVRTIKTHDIRKNALMESTNESIKKEIPIIDYDYTAPSSPLAQKYSGYKYSIAPLKQTNETIIVFQKPYKTKSCLHDTLAYENGDESITCGALDIEKNRVGVSNTTNQDFSSAGGKLSSLHDIRQFYEKHFLSLGVSDDLLDSMLSEIRSCNIGDTNLWHNGVVLDDKTHLVFSCNLKTQDFLSNVSSYEDRLQEVQGFLNDYPTCRHLYDGLLQKVKVHDQDISPLPLYVLSYIGSLLHELIGSREKDMNLVSNLDVFLLVMTYAYLFNDNIHYYIKSTTETQGRYPAQAFISSQTAEVLDRQSGDRPSWKGQNHNTAFNPYGGNALLKSKTKREGKFEGFNNSNTGCSKILHKCDFEKDEHDLYFYAPKVSKSERNAGCEEMPLTNANRDDAELTNAEDRQASTHNSHPTLKPISLIERILKLFKTPNAQRILIPFSGSGSEIIGAYKAGFEYIEGSEINEAYVEIAKARIKHWCK